MRKKIGMLVFGGKNERFVVGFCTVTLSPLVIFAGL
jgi:hypothetical protein